MNEDKNIYIGITGLAGSGKDTFGKFIMNNVGEKVVPHRVALADPLKRVVAELYGVDIDLFYDRDKKEEPINKEDELITPRYLLQQFGTEVIRHMDADHWVKRFDKEVEDVISSYRVQALGFGSRNIERNYTPEVLEERKQIRYDCINLVIVPDVRFGNEQQMIKDKGGYLIDIVRPDPDVGEKMDMTHASETSINKLITPDYVIENNSNLVNMYVKAIATLNSLGLR